MGEIVYQGIAYLGYTTGRVRGRYVGGPWSHLRDKSVVYEDNGEETNKFWERVLGSRNASREHMGEVVYQGIAYPGHTTGSVRGGYGGGGVEPFEGQAPRS